MGTISHELVHQFRAEDASGYEKLADTVFDALEEATGKTRAQLIEAEFNRIMETQPHRFKGRSLEVQREIASEEIVARACEDRLSNSRLMKEFVVELENKESGLTQRFSNFLARAIEKIGKLFREILSSYHSTSAEAIAIRDLTDKVSAIQKQFDALLERRTSAAQTKNTSDRGVMFSSRTDVRSWDIDWDSDNHSSLKTQLKDHLGEVNNMEPVADVIYNKKSAKPYYEILEDLLKTWDYKIQRKEYGTILFDKDGIKSIRKYVNTDQEAAASMAVPYVLKRGKAISGHKNHKGKGSVSVTFAAPVVINGTTGNIAVCVMYGAGRVHSLRVLTPEGKEFDLLKITDAESTTTGRSQTATVDPYINSAPADSIPAFSENVKENDSKGPMLQERAGGERGVDAYTEKQYNDFGWARANDLLTAKENESLRSKFAAAVSGQAKPQKSKSGEYMISVGEGAENKIVYMKGTIDSPIITRVLEIALYDETQLSEKRRELYETERRGIQQETSGIFRRYDSSDFGYKQWAEQRKGIEGQRHHHGFGTDGRAGGSKTKRITRFRINDDGSYTATYADGTQETFSSEDGDIRYQERTTDHSAQGEKYSYASLISKPDMKVTMVGGNIPNSRADILVLAKKNAASVGRRNKDGSVSVYVDDVGADVLLGTDGLKHGLRRARNVLDNPNFIVTLKAGEIIKNSIKINELLPTKENSSGSYVLIGVARNTNGDLYIVRSVINQFNNELDSMDVLYAINAKKEELAATKSPGSTAKLFSVTSSAISISNLLDLVNNFFPDVLPEGVLRHYGYSGRPDGDLREDVLYQERTPYRSSRDILLSYAEDAQKKKVRNEFVEEYVARVADLEQKILRLESAESKLALAVDSGNKEDEKFFQKRVDRLSRDLQSIQRDLTKMEESRELRSLVRREKALTRRQAKAEGTQRLRSYKDDQERKNRIGRIQAKTKLLAERILKNNKEHHVPDYLKKPISDFITTIDFSSKRKLDGGEETLVGKRYADILSDVRSALQGRTESPKDRLELDLDPYILEQMEELEKQIREFMVEENSFVLNKMRSEQLKDLDFILTGIIRALNNVDRSFGSAGYHRVSELAESSIASMQEMKKKTTSENGWIKKLLSWNSFTPYTAFSRFGEGGKAIYHSILNGWGEYARLAKSIIAFSENTWNKKEASSWTKNVRKVELNGQEFYITDAQLMYLYLVNKREQGIQHLDGQGFVVEEIPKQAVFRDNGNRSRSNLIKSTKEQRDTFFERYLPEGSRQREVADKLQRFLAEECALWGNEVSMIRWGYRAFTDPNYVPLYSDKRQLASRAPEATNFDLNRILNLGFTNSLNVDAKNSLLIYDVFDVFAEHTSDMAKYRSLGLPILDAVRWLNYRVPEYDENGVPHRGDVTMKTVMDSAYGNDAYEYVRRFLSDLNGATRNDTDLSENLVGKLARSYKIASVAANLKVALLQPMSYFRASKLLSWDSLLRASAVVAAEKGKSFILGKKAKKYSELAEKYSGMALWKFLGYFDVNISKGIASKIKRDETSRDKIIDLSMKGAEYGDKWTLALLFKACHLELSSQGELVGLSQEEAWKKTGELLDQVIVQTQVVDSTVTRSHIMRGKSYTTRALTAFLSEPTVSYNLLAEGFFDVHAEMRRGKSLKQALNGKAGRTLGRAFVAYGVTSLASAILEALMQAWRDDDEDPFWEDFLKAIPENLYENISIVSKIPLMKEVKQLSQNLAKETNYDSGGMEYEAINSFISAIKKCRKLVESGEYSVETVYDTLSEVIKALSYITGIAASNLERELVDLWNNTFGEAYDMKLSNNKPTTLSRLEVAHEEGTVRQETEKLVFEKYEKIVREYPNMDDKQRRKKAEQSVKISISSYYKKMFVSAIEESDPQEMERIREILAKSGLYENVAETLERWKESYEEDKAYRS